MLKPEQRSILEESGILPLSESDTSREPFCSPPAISRVLCSFSSHSSDFFLITPSSIPSRSLRIRGSNTKTFSLFSTMTSSSMSPRRTNYIGRYSPLSHNLWRAGAGFRDNLDLLLTQKNVPFYNILIYGCIGRKTLESKEKTSILNDVVLQQHT